MNVIVLDSSPERQDTISLSDIEFSFDSLESIEPLEKLDSSLPEVNNSYLCTSQASRLVTPGRSYTYRAPESTEYLPTGRPGEVAIYQDSLKAGLRFPLHPFLVEFFCTFNLSPGQLVPNALRMINYYLLVCIRKGIDPSVDVFRLLFEMKPLDRYDCYVVFSHRDRGVPAHEHFKIPNCPTSNSGWKSRYFFVKPVDEEFNFPLNWCIPPFEDFNSTPILDESEIDSLIMLRAIAPLGRSMNDVLTDDALVSAGIGRPYDMSADKFSEDFLEELARKNSRDRRKRRRENTSVDPASSEAPPATDPVQSVPVTASPVMQNVAAPVTNTPESHRPRGNRAPVDSRQSGGIRRPIEKVAEDCQAVISCLDWELIEASKDQSPESLERSIMVEERRVLSLRHAAFHKIHDQADRIEQIGHDLEEKSNDLANCRRSLTEKNELLVEREARIAEVESLLTENEELLTEKEELLQQSSQKVESLQESIHRLENELITTGESAVKAYKSTDEYMTTVGMVGVSGREMAYRKSREWLAEQFPNLDFFGAPFIPTIDDDDEDEDD
ncbi:Uncharacterized protein Adt_18525 [Abeliophyllum distichum]|uniref:Transposase (putative) gypsy type domain-containing protein n=1 Tax=Abeliophyllum distichum TaxID=126358 RepID=A0ABD1TJL5_9LAMI